MPIHVKVVTAEAYAKWVEDKRKEIAAKADDPNKVWTLEALVSRGEKVYNANCAACHQPNGKGGGAIKALDASPLVLDADRGKEIHVLLNGQNNIMPAWKQLSDTEIPATQWAEHGTCRMRPLIAISRGRQGALPVILTQALSSALAAA